MCGRYSVLPTVKGNSNYAKQVEKSLDEARYNAAPSQKLPVIINSRAGEVQFFSWGLVPSWTKDLKTMKKAINARAETLTEKPMFRSLLKSKRCLVPADSFYEWKATETGKQPYRIMLRSEDMFCFAGLWNEWLDKSTGEILNTYTIITTDANKLVSFVHDRMPVILDPEKEKIWLANDLKQDDLLSLLQPYDAERMKLYPVSPLVNSPLNNSAEIINSL